MWQPNSVQVPVSLVMKCLHGEEAPEVLLAAAGFLTLRDSTVESLTKQYALTGKDTKRAQEYLQIEYTEMEEKVESPSTPTEETSNTGSDTDKIRESIQSRFPNCVPTSEQLNDLNRLYDPPMVEDAMTVIHSNHLEKNNVYEPMGLLFWMLKNNDRVKLSQKAQIVSSKPKSQGSILGEALERAKRQAPPKPGPTPEKIEELRRRNEAARGKDQ